ncbi:MAG: hypothetical protein SPH02_02360, partial [Campylobacter sp.]|nr:hypothetical protein [Campylobacter sp.]
QNIAPTHFDNNGRLRYTMSYTLKKNLPFLFTFENIKTYQKQTMVCETEFTHLKTKLGVHSGLKLENKMSLFLIIFL